MKYHITRKEIYRLFDKVRIINSKQIEELRKRGFNPIYYNAGVYGWNYDVYSVWLGSERYALIEGYRPLKADRIDGKLFDELMKGE